MGAGCGCGRFCGAVAGGLATLGQMHIDTRAHAAEGFADRCAAFVEAAEAHLGSVQCEVLKAKYRTEECRCLKTLELAAEVLEQHAAKKRRQRLSSLRYSKIHMLEASCFMYYGFLWSPRW